MAARSARWIPVALLLACAAAGPAAAARPGLTVRGDGTLLLNGKPYRGIGVNFFDAFARTLPDASVTSYDGAFAELERRRIPFARFMCGGFWPVEMRLYREKPEEYFRFSRWRCGSTGRSRRSTSAASTGWWNRRSATTWA